MFYSICRYIIPRIVGALFLFLLVAEKLFAGPPFLTDDPVPEDYHHLDMYLFSTTDQGKDGTEIQAPAIEFDYGLIPNVAVNITVPYVANLPKSSDELSGHGIGDTQLSMVYRFLQENEHRPQVSFSPSYYIPTGYAKRGLGNGKPWVSLPFWAQKSWGSWTTYGGGGYALNSAPEMRNYFFGGWVLEKELNDYWTLGGEIFSQGAVSNTESSSTIVNLGGNYNVTKTLSILFSAGGNILGSKNIMTYLGIDWAIV
ncbi:MAG: transporter [Gammaproteobacteria bacterium]|nr:MAG: transporter [Gammaproteobacteria bacterium]